MSVSKCEFLSRFADWDGATTIIFSIKTAADTSRFFREARGKLAELGRFRDHLGEAEDIEIRVAERTYSVARVIESIAGDSLHIILTPTDVIQRIQRPRSANVRRVVQLASLRKVG